jgi:hypothetical protein
MFTEIGKCYLFPETAQEIQEIQNLTKNKTGME